MKKATPLIVTFSIVMIAISLCMSLFENFFNNFLKDSTISLIFNVSGIIGIILCLLALRYHKRESNKFSIFSVSLVVLIILTLLFLIALPPCQCGVNETKAREARIIAMLDQIGEVAKRIYDNEGSYATLCNDSSLLNDQHIDYGDYLKELEKDIILQLEKLEVSEKDFRLTCFSSDEHYCVSSALNKENYSCINDLEFNPRTSMTCNSSYKCSVE
jgi:Tfp pilus assembly protein PilE